MCTLIMAVLLLVLLLAISTHGIPNKTCDRIEIGSNFYEKETIWGNKGRAYNLNVHRSTNVLYYSYSTSDGFADADFQLGFIDIDTKDAQIIAGIRGGCAVAVNQNSDDVYLGGSEGIYKYNRFTKLADFYGAKGRNIWSLFYNKNLFFISFPDQKLHIEVDGKFAHVKEFSNFEVDHFHVNRDGFIYFANKTGLYSYDSAKMRVIVINELIMVRQLTEDNEGNLYLCTNFGIYVVSGGSVDLVKVLDMRNMHGLAFDKNNNIIYSDEKSIIRLVHSETGCNTNEHW